MQPGAPRRPNHGSLIEAARQQFEAAEGGGAVSAREPGASPTELAEGTRKSPPDDRSSAVPLPTGAFEGYRIVREIGHGGQGVVYQALQESTKRKVAIKVLVEGRYASDALRKRFEREIELAAQLKHPNIVPVFHSGLTDDGRQYLVMDYVRGAPLNGYVRDKKLPVESALALFAQVCEAVQHAHQRGIIHRDIKPSNILVDFEGTPRILDFGLAKRLGDAGQTHATESRQMLGTLPYMSPEQTRGNPDEIDTRSDVYSLGVVLYELLTGQFPYPLTGSTADVLRHIAETPPTPPVRLWSPDSGIAASTTRRRLRSRHCPINDEIQMIVLRALAKEPQRRYQSAGELAADIAHYLAGEPIEAKRDSAWYMLRKLAGRHLKTTVVAGSLLVIVLSALSILAYFYRDRTQALERQARSDRALVEKAREFDATGKAALAMVRQMSIGWFLLEWQAGRLDRAREIMRDLDPQSPERRCMTFLLDPDAEPEPLVQELPFASRGLGSFVIAERERGAGRLEQAQRWYEQCLKDGAPPHIHPAARARLREMAGAHAEDRGAKDH